MGAVSHVITFLDNMAVCIPTLDACDQFVWLPSAAVPWTATQVEQYGYRHRNAINLSAVMPVMEFRVTDEEGTHLCMAGTLIFKGSVLAYNPTRDEVEWVPTHSVTNSLSWVEEKMVVVLGNFVSHAPKRQTASWNLGPTTSWPGLTTPWRRRASRCKRRVTSLRKMSVRRWRDGGSQTLKRCLVMRCADGVRLNRRWSHEDDHGSGHP